MSYWKVEATAELVKNLIYNDVLLLQNCENPNLYQLLSTFNIYINIITVINILWTDHDNSYVCSNVWGWWQKFSCFHRCRLKRKYLIILWVQLVLKKNGSQYINLQWFVIFPRKQRDGNFQENSDSIRALIGNVIRSWSNRTLMVNFETKIWNHLISRDVILGRGSNCWQLVVNVKNLTYNIRILVQNSKNLHFVLNS